MSCKPSIQPVFGCCRKWCDPAQSEIVQCTKASAGRSTPGVAHALALPLFPTRRLGGQRGTRPQPPRVLPSSPCSSCGRKKRLKMGKQSHFKRFVVYKSKGHGILTIVILADFWDYNSKKARSTEITRSYGYKCDELKRSEEKEPSPWNL